MSLPRSDMPHDPMVLRTPASTSQSDSSVPCAVTRRELYRPVAWKVMSHGRRMNAMQRTSHTKRFCLSPCTA